MTSQFIQHGKDYVDPILHCDHLGGVERAGCSAFLRSVACALSVMACLLLLMFSLVVYIL